MDDFLDRMAIGRAAAARKRENGGGGGRWYRTAKEMHRRRGAAAKRGTWQHEYELAQAYWQSARDDAIEDVRRACYGDEWEI